MEQSEYRIAAELKRRQLTDASAGHLEHVLDFLRSRAYILYIQHNEIGDGDNYDRWLDLDLAAQMEEAGRWVIESELYRALRAELVGGIRESCLF